MTRLVSLDPGLREAGLAVFEDGRLVLAALIRSPSTCRGAGAWLSMAIEVQDVVCLRGQANIFVTEEMVVRQGGAYSKDLLQLNGVAGAVCGILAAPEAYSYTPEQWGGQVPKSIKNTRTLKKLTSDELSAIQDCPESLRHNVLDAIAIGLFHMKR